MSSQKVQPSLVQGIFVHRSEKKKSRSKPAKETLWYQQYKVLCDHMETQIQEIEKSAYKETFSDLVKFVKEYQISKAVEIKEIPAAVLVMGVNMPDHSNIFCMLEKEMHSSSLPTTMVLQSKDCANISALMQRFVPGIINKYQQEMGLEEIAVKKSECTFSDLLSYYKSLPASRLQGTSKKSPKKKKKDYSELKSKPIVVLIQDVEAFSPVVLEQFILMCSLYASELPVVLVFGMASAMVTLHNILSQKAMCCLGTETFYSMTAIEYLTKVIQKVVMSPENPFKLGPRIFQLIVDAVLYHDFSVSNLSSMLKYCLLEHFCGNDSAYVCCKSEDMKKHLQHLTNKQLEKFRKMPSLSRYLENNPELASGLKKENDLKNLIADLLERHHSYYGTMVILLNCLYILIKDLPGHPLGKHLRELYCLSLQRSITTQPAYLEAVKLLKMHSKDELVSKIESCLEFLKESGFSAENPSCSGMFETLMAHLQILNNLSKGDFEKESMVCNDFPSGKILSRSQFQERIRLCIKARPSKFENCRENAIDSFTSLFKSLHPPSDLPLHEVLYFDNAPALKHHLMTVPRISLHRNLLNPQAILKCECCKVTEAHETTPSMPDVSVLYKLHLEYGKLINLRDWLEAFKSTKENAESEESTISAADAELNLRFMQTVSELQLLGFVTPTKRKTDHVARLTFESF